jgi:hypothetical protein
MADRLPTLTITYDTFFAFQWHMAVSSRCWAAFDLLMRGHYNDAATLARGVWETALHLVAFHRGIVTRQDYVSGPATKTTPLTSTDYVKHMKKLDSRVQRRLIWKNPMLTDSARRSVETFHDIANAATHKSMLSLASSYTRFANKQPLYIFPQFDKVQCEGISNIILLATWCLMSTLTHLEPVAPPADSAWREHHKKLMRVFAETVGKGPSKLVTNFNEVVQQLFS